MKKLFSLLVILLVVTFGPRTATADLVTYSDKSLFLSQTGATSATGPLPYLGYVTAAKVGSITISNPGGLGFGVPNTRNPADYLTPLLPGIDLAVNGFEDLDITLDSPAFAFGFDFAEHITTTSELNGMEHCGSSVWNCIDSVFTISLLSGGNPVGSFSFNAPNDVASFIGVWSSVAFDRVQIRESRTQGGIENDYFGQFYMGTLPTASPPKMELFVIDKNTVETLPFDGKRFVTEMGRDYCVVTKITNFENYPIVAGLSWEEYTDPKYPIMDRREAAGGGTMLLNPVNQSGSIVTEPLTCQSHKWQWIEPHENFLDMIKEYVKAWKIVKTSLVAFAEALAKKKILYEATSNVAAAIGMLFDVVEGFEDFIDTRPTSLIGYTVFGNYWPEGTDRLLHREGPRFVDLLLKVQPDKKLHHLSHVISSTSAAVLTETGVAAIVGGLFPGGQGLIMVGTAALVGQVAGLYIAYDEYKIAADPPDANFTNVAVPSIATIPELETSPEGPAKRLAETLLALEAVVRAEGASRDRAVGAEQAGDLMWQSTQLMAAGRYGAQAASLKGQASELFQTLIPFIRDKLAPAAPAVIQHLQTNGLPYLERKLLAQRGWTQKEIEVLRQALIDAGTAPLTEAESILTLWKVMPLTSMQPSTNALREGISIKLRSLGEYVRDVDAGPREALDQQKAAIKSLLARGVPSLELKAAVEKYLNTVRTLIEKTNNLPAIEQDLNFGYAALMHFQKLSPTAEGLLSFFDKALAAGGIGDGGLIQSLRTKLVKADAWVKEGRFPEAAGILGAFVNEVRAQSGKGIVANTATDLLAYGLYVKSLAGGL